MNKNKIRMTDTVSPYIVINKEDIHLLAPIEAGHLSHLLGRIEQERAKVGKDPLALYDVKPK